MRKIIIFSIILNIFFSCSNNYKIYKAPKPNPNEKDKYSEYCHSCLFVIIDNSIAENKVFVSDSKNSSYSLFPSEENSSYPYKDTIYYDKLVLKKKENDCEDIIKVRNFKAVDIFVNKDSVLIRNFTFSAYRFVIIKKSDKKRKPTYIFTNDISSYPKVLTKLNNEIPEIIPATQKNK